jgi:hypothetical protein
MAGGASHQPMDQDIGVEGEAHESLGSPGVVPWLVGSPGPGSWTSKP